MSQSPEYQEWKLKELLAVLGLEAKDHGKELQLSRCPFCEKDRQKSSTHFSFNRDTGAYNCVKCGAKGNYISFRREMGVDPFPVREYRKIDQTKAKQLTENLPTDYRKSYEANRKIPESVLAIYGVGFCNHEKLGPCRVYQYWRNGEIVNLKYVNREKKMLTEFAAMPVYYGTQFLNGGTALHVTEGEDDCHALASCGFENVVSVPYGAGTYTEEMGEVNSRFKKIVLLFDNDQRGQEGAKKFGQKAGYWKCWNAVLPFKDARECLINGFGKADFEKHIEKAKQFEYSTGTKYRPALNLEQCLSLYETECKTNERGVRVGFDIVDDITGGLRGGDLFSIVANPGCFKTTVLFNFASRAVFDTDGIVIVFSFEMGIESTIERNIQNWTNNQRVYHMRAQIKRQEENWQTIKNGLLAEDKINRIYFTDEPAVSLDGIEKIIERTEEVSGKKTTLIGIDYLDFIDEQGNEYERVKKIMVGLKQLLKKRKCAGIIVCQTNRSTADSDEEVGARSAKGGTSIEASSDFLIGLWMDGDRLVGRFNKHRRVVGDITKPYPYLSFHLDPASYTVQSIALGEKPKKDNGKKRSF